MPLDPDVTSVEPTGLGRSLLVASIFFAFPTALVVCLRTWVRIKYKVFGLDDGLMLFGWILYMIVICIVSRSIYVGVGTRDAQLNSFLQTEGHRYLWIFQVVYCFSLLFTKGSICVTLLRIAVKKAHRVIIWVTLIISTLSTLTVIFGLFLICRPISAAWGHPGTCAPPIVIVCLGYLISVAAVITDWTCAILPGFMLYKSNMKQATKISINIILALGALASIATIIRFPYLKYYAAINDYLYTVAYLILWSMCESGIGITACSLPSLRRLLKNRFQFDTSDNKSGPQTAPYSGPGMPGLSTSTMITSRRFNKAAGSTVVGDGDWERLDDASSSRKIHVQVDLEMQSLGRPETTHTDGSVEKLVS